MHWDDALAHLFEDLEQQAEGLRLADRDADIADRSLSEYAEVDLASRLHASTGSVIRLHVLGVGAVAGNLARVGRDWCLLEGDGGPGGVGQEWILRFDGVRRAEGLSGRAVSEPARGVATRLGSAPRCAQWGSHAHLWWPTTWTGCTRPGPWDGSVRTSWRFDPTPRMG